MTEIDYEAQRLENLIAKQRILAELNLNSRPPTRPVKRTSDPNAAKSVVKRRRVTRSGRSSAAGPQRSSARIARSTTRLNYNEDDVRRRRLSAPVIQGGRRPKSRFSKRSSTTSRTPSTTTAAPTSFISGNPSQLPLPWTPTASPPTRSPLTSLLHFPSHPTFNPNKTPLEILSEGAFGGSYFRPYTSINYPSIHLSTDYLDLPSTFLSTFRIPLYLTSPTYQPHINKYAVAAGTDIEAWEAAGWIDYNHDVRGWFQWYLRFWLGRRCEDDERQVGRWERCVGKRGRWRRALLKKYVAMGVRSVVDEGDDDDDDGDRGRGEVSPVMHQTCHHWGWEIRQEELDEVWRVGLR